MYLAPGTHRLNISGHEADLIFCNLLGVINTYLGELQAPCCSAVSSLDQRVFREETEWTFGQILPVLLLVMQIFTVNFTKSRSKGPEVQQTQDPTRLLPGPAATLHQPTMSNRIQKSPYWLSRDFYEGQVCLGPNAIALGASILGLTLGLLAQLFRIGLDMAPSAALLHGWAGSLGILCMAIVLFFPGCASTFLVGIQLENLMKDRIKSRRVRQGIIFWLSFSLLFIYQIPFLTPGFSTTPLRYGPNCTSLFILPAAFYSFYALLRILNALLHRTHRSVAFQLA